MNKTAIKKYSIEARKKLMESVSDRAGMLGITEKECSEPINRGADFEIYKTAAGTEVTLNKMQSEQRRILVDQIKKRGFEAVIEEVAYTWFNRICAIRFMEVNDYLPSRVRVLTSEKEGKNEPDLVTLAPDVDLDFTEEEREYILEAKMKNKLDDLFKMLFIKQCNQLHKILPELFEETEDYTEMLLNISYTNEDDIIYMLVNKEVGIPEEDFNVTKSDEKCEISGQVEIIGWLYQYYNTDLKDDTFAKIKNKIKITKERIPSATQLFTPDWIVRYMVENSVGKLWIEHLRALDNSVDEKIIAEEFGWKYYLPEARQEEVVNLKLAEIRTTYKELKPTDIKCIDPCMGSGHVLIAMFDVLMDIYKSVGYSERDAVFDIIEKNLYGLDIDKRAYQLAYFAVMMKCRGYNRRFFRERDKVKLSLNVYVIMESNDIQRSHLNYFGNSLCKEEKTMAIQQMGYLLEVFHDAREYGSILSVDNCDWGLLKRFVVDLNSEGQITFDNVGCNITQGKLKVIVSIAEILNQKYESVVTNPPYMGISNGNEKLNDYVKSYFPESKADLFAVFIEKCIWMTKKNYYSAMITQHSWMFISTYEKLRSNVLKNDILNMVHLGARAFEEIAGEVVQTTTFVRRNSLVENYLGEYVRVVGYLSQKEKEKAYLRRSNLFFAKQEAFENIPGYPFSYWAGKGISNAFVKGVPLGSLTVSRNGMKTGDNGKFVRLWWEIEINKMKADAFNVNEAINSGKKWFPYNKGGEARKWYGNNEFVVNWENKGSEIFGNAKAEGRNVQDYPDEMKFSESGTWSLINTGRPTFRYKIGSLSDIAGMSFYLGQKMTKYYLGFCNTIIASEILQLIAPTINYQAGDIGRLPIIYDEEYAERIDYLVDENIKLAKEDWDSYETSWDFSSHPLVGGFGKISEAFFNWKTLCDERMNTILKNEKELNNIFIKIYNLCDEFSEDVSQKEITMTVADERKAVISLISYAVGCMFGRYSIEHEGIQFAGGVWDIHKYGNFLPDADNCIPITDENYFNDDIVSRFEEFVKLVYGEEEFIENIEYIAKILGNKGENSSDVIRNYFICDFYKDHCSMYSGTGSGKRPIYWMLDSGKFNGLKVLVYIHRYDQDTIGKIRTEYLHKTQNHIETAVKNSQYILENSPSVSDKSKATKAIDKYTKQLAEMKLFDEAIAHVSSKRIHLNLDDGVVSNYEKFQNIEISQEGKKTISVDLLAKIK